MTTGCHGRVGEGYTGSIVNLHIYANIFAKGSFLSELNGKGVSMHGVVYRNHAPLSMVIMVFPPVCYICHKQTKIWEVYLRKYTYTLPALKQAIETLQKILSFLNKCY